MPADSIKRGNSTVRTWKLPCRWLEIWKKGIIRIIDKPIVPFDNNLTERDLRMMKVKMKISGGIWNFLTGRAIALIRCYISTIQKNGISVIEGVILAFENTPWCQNLR